MTNHPPLTTDHFLMHGSPPLDVAVTILLFAGACLGHLTVAVTSHNWWYGLALPKRVGHLFHLLHGLLFLAFTVLLLLTCGPDLLGLFGPASASTDRQDVA